MTLTLPKTSEIMELVGLLIDEEPMLRVGQGWDLTQPNPGAYITFLQGRDNAVEGAVIADLAATMYIGGKLILMPESTLREQFNSGTVCESVVEALNEVVNNLRWLIDKGHVIEFYNGTLSVPSAKSAKSVEQAAAAAPAPRPRKRRRRSSNRPKKPDQAS